MEKKIGSLILLIWVYIIIAVFPLFILYIGKTSFPESDFFSQFTDTIPDFTTIIIVTISLPALGAFLSILTGKMKTVYFWKLDKGERFHIATISLLLSIVLWRFFSVLNFLHYFGVIILFIFFLLYLPFANLYLNSIDFNKLKLFIIPAYRRTNLKVIENILFSLVVLLLIHTSVLFIDSQISAFKHYQVLLSRYPQIAKAEPKIVYHSSVVVIKGKGFDWKQNSKVRLMTRYGEVATDFWTDSKITFWIPLNWKPGMIKLWVEKPILWNGKKTILKSSMQEVKLIPRGESIGPEDEAYFKQLNTLDKETLLLNGYK